MRCEFCSKETQIKKVQKYQYIDAELENVFLDNIELRFCADCGLESPIIPKILKLHNTIGYAIVCKNGLLNGAEIQFLRKNLRIKSQDWAKLLRTDKSVYSRWENASQPISPQSDLLIRYLYLRLLEERKELRLEKKIVESLSEAIDENIAIVINVEQIEDYSYLPIEQALSLAQAQKLRAASYDFELNESNLFLSEIERPLPYEEINNKPFKISPEAANQELALAA
jgi:hypothetical protein